MKKKYIVIFIFFTLISQSQNSVSLKYFLNTKSIKSENLEVFIITEKDSIKLKTTKNKIEFPNITSNFSLLIKTNGQEFKFPKCMAEYFQENTEIAVGKITDIKKLTKSPFNSNAFYLKEKYLIEIENSESVNELNFISIIHNLRLSKNKFVLKQTGMTDILSRKNGI